MSCDQNRTPCNECDNGCLEFPQGQCVQYSGPDTKFLNIPTGLDLDSIIQGLDTTLEQLQDELNNAVFTVAIANTDSVTLAGGSLEEALTANVNISGDPDNILVINNDGLFVPTGSGGEGNASLTNTYFDI